MSIDFNERFAKVITENGGTKSQAAAKLGVSAAYVSQLCAGTRAPSERTIADICRIWGISEDWLLHGLEPMRAVVSREEEISELVGRALNGSNDLKKAVIRMICSRTDEELAILDKALRDVYGNLNKSE